MGAVRLVTRGWRRIAAGAAVLTVAGATVLSLIVAQQGAASKVARQLYADNCARCHGTNLQGQPNWMERLPSGRLPAPPHDETGHTWHHSDQQLLVLVRDGFTAISPGYETDMPAYKDVLTDAEIISIIDYLKGTWPEQARAYQAERTAADQN